MERFELHIEAESRIRWKVYVRFGGEFSETDHSNMARRRLLSLLLLRVIAASDIPVILRRSHVQGKARQSCRLVTTIFPIARKIHILITESRQRAVVGHGYGLLQVQSEDTLGLYSRTAKCEKEKYAISYSSHVFYI